MQILDSGFVDDQKPYLIFLIVYNSSAAKNTLYLIKLKKEEERPFS